MLLRDLNPRGPDSGNQAWRRGFLALLRHLLEDGHVQGFCQQAGGEPGR